MARLVTVKVGGETHQMDLDEALHIHNADAERHEVAADMAWWGVIAAAAEAQVQRLAAVSASWHAGALSACLKQDDKMSEWKAKASATSHPEFLKIQTDIANAQEMVGRAQTIHWALVRKMDMLKEMLKGDSNDRRGANNIGAGMSAPVPLPGGRDPRLANYKGKKPATTDKED